MHPCINTYTWLLSFLLHNMQDTHKLLGSWVSWIEWYSTLALYMITLCSLHNTSNTSRDIRSFFCHYASSQCSLLNFSYHARFSWSIPKPSLNKPSSVSCWDTQKIRSTTANHTRNKNQRRLQHRRKQVSIRCQRWYQSLFFVCT